MSRNRRRNSYRDKDSIRIFSPEGIYERREPSADAQAMEARGDVERYVNDRGVFLGYKRRTAASDSNSTPAAISVSDMLANVGLARHRFGDVTKHRQFLAARKIRENGLRPSWKYRGKAQGYGIATA